MLLVSSDLYAQRAKVTVAWDPNSEPDLAGYVVAVWDTSKVKIKPDSGDSRYVWFAPGKILNAYVPQARLSKTQTEFTWTDLRDIKPGGTVFCFAVAAFDTAGNHSFFTGLYHKVTLADIEPPAPPGGFRITETVILAALFTLGFIAVVMVSRRRE